MDDLNALFSQAQAGDLEAYGKIVRRFQDMAVGYAYSILGDFHLAEDAAQEAFVEAGAKLRAVYGPLAFPGWLRKIVFKYCDRRIRGNRLKTVPLDASDSFAGFGLDPLAILEKRETHHRVRQAIRALPEVRRRVITLFYISDYSQREISAFLDVPLSTVKKRLYGARRQLRGLLTERMDGMVKKSLEKKAPSRDEGFAQKVLKNVEATRMGSTFIGSFYSMLKAAGGHWSVARLMGTFGHAFSFLMKKGGGEIWQNANIDWWLLWDQLRKLGYEVQEFQAIQKGSGNHEVSALNPEELQKLKERTWDSVVASIDGGVPAVAWQPMTVEQRKEGIHAYEWALLAGYDAKKRTYTVYHENCRNEYDVQFDKFGYTDPVNWYCVFVLGKSEPFDGKALAVQSLDQAVAYAHDTRFKKKDCCYPVDAIGLEAYELWMDAFLTGEVNLRFAHGHASALRWMRSNASEYMREISDLFPDGIGQNLLNAAAYYDMEVGAAERLLKICREASDKDGFSTGMTREAVATLNAALEADRKAVGEIETTLKEMGA